MPPAARGSKTSKARSGLGRSGGCILGHLSAFWAWDRRGVGEIGWRVSPGSAGGLGWRLRGGWPSWAMGAVARIVCAWPGRHGALRGAGLPCGRG